MSVLLFSWAVLQRDELDFRLFVRGQIHVTLKIVKKLDNQKSICSGDFDVTDFDMIAFSVFVIYWISCKACRSHILNFRVEIPEFVKK